MRYWKVYLNEKKERNNLFTNKQIDTNVINLTVINLNFKMNLINENDKQSGFLQTTRVSLVDLSCEKYKLPNLLSLLKFI